MPILALPFGELKTDMSMILTNVRYWHLADIAAYPPNVRYWTQADKVGCPPETACPLMTQSGHQIS